MSGTRLVIWVTNRRLFKKLELREVPRDLSPGPSESPLPIGGGAHILVPVPSSREVVGKVDDVSEFCPTAGGLLW